MLYSRLLGKETHKMKKITQMLLFALLISGCIPALSNAPTSETTTETAPRSKTPRPSNTALPSVTPYPPLQTEVPYLMFTTDGKNFVIMDANGHGRKQFQLPDDGYTSKWNLENVSPNGNWLAFFTGSVNEPYDLTLNLYDLKNEKVFPITTLLSDDYPNNLEFPVETLEFPNCSDIECKTALFKIGLSEGIEAMAWSSDSKLLAFSAQIDSFSSDIYVFSIEDKSITRLTNEFENIHKIFWSPDEKNILYEPSIEGSSFYINTTWYLVNLKNGESQKALTENSSWRSLGWFNEDLFLVSTAVDSPGFIDTMYIDIKHQDTKIIWQDIADKVIFDSKNNRIVFSRMSHDINNPKLEEGTYILDLNSMPLKISNEFLFLLSEQLSGDSYLAIRKDKTLVNISAEGNISRLANEISSEAIIKVSPNKNWLFIARENIISLYTNKMILTKSWDKNIYEIIWSPDSKGAFFYDKTNLYYVAIPDGSIVRVSVCKSTDCQQIKYTWLP